MKNGLSGLFSFLNKKELPKCAWCEKESDNFPFVKIKDKKEYFFCSEECKRNFRINYNKKAKNRTCSACLLKKIKR